MLLLTFLTLTSSMFCNYYPMDAEACISKTEGVQCIFSLFENACLSATLTSYGCMPTLNKEACLNQLTNGDNTEATCIFRNKCGVAKKQHFKHLGCSTQYSKYSCMNALNDDCIWGETCTKFTGQVPQSDKCSTVYTSSVTPSLCQKIQTLSCMSGEFQNDYQCIDVTETMLTQLVCSQSGLNEQGCISIQTSGQACIFEKNQCRNVLPTYPQKCSLALNRLGCLQITKPDLLCQWRNGQCQDFVIGSLTCGLIYEVNASVCSSYKGVCRYDSTNRRCQSPTTDELKVLTCNTYGLTKETCLSIKNYKCTFFRGVCEELTTADLNLFQCDMLLNESACVNIQTEFQYCKWDGKSCTRIFLNQDISCPIEINGTSTFNGKVCQNISKMGILCKYNPKTNKCVSSTITDYCDSPFLNLQGCISISRPGTACYWTLNGCEYATIIQNQTTCSSLGYANAIACSQVYEDQSMGCYFNQIIQQCESIVISEAAIFLDKVVCSDLSLGLNKITCASITTPGQICRWYQNQCVQIKKKEQIASAECISLQFVNKYACGLVEYGKEPCRYLSDQLGCVNTIISPMPCNQAGLNSYACAIASGSCYFDTTVNQCKFTGYSSSNLTAESAALVNSIECDSSSPTLDICIAIVTENQLCGWSYRSNKCTNQYVPYNSQCSDFSGETISINANVCAAILNEFPDYNWTIDQYSDQNRGYCKFNSDSGNCEVNTDECTTTCCNEESMIGINAHFCSKNSSQKYCYFGNNLRCTELTTDTIDIYSDDALQAFYNSNQFTCAQMQKDSCYMIDWSTKQRCYSNGSVCLNVNFSNYKFDSKNPDPTGMIIFTLVPAILNKYACLAIEGNSPDKKYFDYDDVNHRCKLLTPVDATEDKLCEDILGNRNVCLTYTSKLLCKWDPILLKCLTLSAQESSEITSCNQNQNINACINNPNTACVYSTDSDRCIDALFNQPCSYFDALGKVSKSVCAKITTPKQICRWKDFKCESLDSEKDKISSGCDVNGANAIACYKLTQSNCRWDSINYICYENQTQMSNLGCSDNLNKVLCLQVTKEACYWNEDQYQCLKFSANSKTFLTYSTTYSYNEMACASIIGDAYYFYLNNSDSTDPENYKCIQLNGANVKSCDSKSFNEHALSMNQQACLLNTNSNPIVKCFYDSTESIPNKRCKQFTDDRTSCSGSIQINIGVCMEIPKQCYFNVNTLSCENTNIAQNQLCSTLKAYSTNSTSKRFYNYMACAAISTTLTQSDGQTQCLGRDNNVITCNYEKYCFWDISQYTCNVKPVQNLLWDPEHKKDVKVCSTDLEMTCTSSSDCPAPPATTTSTTTSSGGGSRILQDGSSTTTTEPAAAKCDTVKKPDPKCNDDDPLASIKYVDDCSILYSKALCLEMSKAACYFDLNQGGCRPITGNEWKLPNCNSIYSTKSICPSTDSSCTPQIINSCSNTSTKNAICKTNTPSTIQPLTCTPIQRNISPCGTNTIQLFKSSYKCSDIKTLASIASCAGASDECKYDNSTLLCSTVKPTQDSNLKCLSSCDISFSQKMCEYCGCNYTYLGYCQQNITNLKLNSDNSNLYYLCNEVNLLTTSDKSKPCGNVAQSCIYSGTTCLDATGYTCSNLIGKIVTQRACIRCLEKSVIYNQKNNQCSLVNTLLESCDNLNIMSCLLQTDINCKWQNYQCINFTTYQSSDSKDCQIYNVKSCNLIPNCWVNPITKYCQTFDPTLGQCNDYQTQSICIQSNKEQCYWDNGQCKQIINLSNFQCEIVNQYSCLNNTIKQCGWSNILNQCKTITFINQDNTTCTSFLDSTYNDYNQFNAKVCSQIIVDKKTNKQQNCIRDSLYKCREQISTDIIKCQTPGLNQYGCINNTIDKCKWENSQCINENSTTIGCNPKLNLNACFAQEATCKFVASECQQFKDINDQEVILSVTDFSYSVSVCTVLDIKDSLPNYLAEPLIYSQVTQRCVSVAQRQPFISTCTYTGMNISTCLQKTTVFCRFQNNSCVNIERSTLSTIKTCESNLNWFACTNLSIKCKFVLGKCQPLTDEDTCIGLNIQKALVNANVCASRLDKPCKLNSLTNQCEEVKTQQLCNTNGLNLQGCQFWTKGSMCIFSNGICASNYNDLNCTDKDYKLNEDKCYSITTTGQYCFFDSESLGCQNIGTDQEYLYKTCEVPVDKKIKQTNAITCSQSSEACFYDKKSSKQCIKYPQEVPDDLNNDWANSISLSKTACQMYTQNSLKVYWDGKKCSKLTTTQLQFLNCIEPVNKYGCVSITTPGQYCIFKDNKCQQADLTKDEFKICLLNQDVNSSAFCEITTDAMCKYQSSSFSCIGVDSAIKCSDLSSTLSSEGYNSLACIDKQDGCIFNKKCYKSPSSGYLFCNDTGVSLANCNAVNNEGCQKNAEGNACIAIIDYSKIKCTDSLNKYGCQRITTPDQYCQYSSNKCQNVSPSGSLACEDVGSINNQIYCEKITNSGCKYDPLNRTCAAVASTDQFQCIRGLNIIACLNNTTPSLKCLFLDYCYGPNADILNCSTSDSTCCPLAKTIESCLYQSKFKCKWDNTGKNCSNLDHQIDKCQGSTNVSINVCASITSSICVFDSSSLSCKSITPTSCDQVQSPQQCKMINNIPCYWNISYSQCQFKQKQSYDECDDIEQQQGNQRSCMDVERGGQMCLYQNNKCTTFYEQVNQNNCLNNINKVACTNQIQSECIWNIQTVQILKISSDPTTIQIDQGICQIFNQYDQTNCSDNLSYLSCLKIIKLGQFCIWHDEKCQQLIISKSTIYQTQQLVLINSNVCGLINDGNKVIYNNQTYTCDIIKDQSLLTCQPFIPGTNKQACLSIKTQKCQWNDTYKICENKENRLLVEQKINNLRLLETISCQLDGLGSKLCAQIQLQLSCGSVQNGCDQIDLNIAKCNDQGLNKYSCLNLLTEPCIWLQNDDDEFYHCEIYTPYVSCSNIPQYVNAIVCTYVQDDACIYNQITQQCQIPNQIYNQCNILGINAIACSQIKGCIFENQQCIQQNENVNLLCNSIPQANYQVCSQAIDRCKYSDLTYGCITSTITDNCNTKGISQLGCNVLDGCKWDNNQCQCLAYLQKYPNCSSIQTYLDCQNLDYCYFEISQSQTNKDITQYLKNTNYGICRNKICEDFEINQCQGNIINGNICYLNNQSQCKMASKCEEIINSSIDCTLYQFNKKQCKNNGQYCITLDCNLLDQQICQQFKDQCIYVGYCKNRTCEYMGQIQCLQNYCDWNDFTQKCSIQLNCSQIKTSDQCLQKKQQSIQCAWIATLDNIEQCTDNGCRFLGISQGECMGTHIGTDVCVQMSDFSCVSCEEITDSCLCLQQQQYCQFNKQTMKCSSYSCQQHNQIDCPISHCKFNQKDKICQPMCQYNYNQEQCNAADDCAWDTINKICTPYTIQATVIQINLPNPNSTWIMTAILMALVLLLN